MPIAFRHYRQAMRDKLFRYKQLVVVLALLLFPTLGALYGFTVAPLRVLFEAGTPIGVLLTTLLCYQLVAMLWARLQRDAIVHEPVAAFLHSLPVDPRVLLFRDVVILSISAIILFLPAGIAFAQHVGARGFDPPSSLMMLYVGISLTCAQLAYLHRWRPGSLAVLISTLVASAAAANGRTIIGLPAACLLLFWAIHRLYFARRFVVVGLGSAAESGTGSRSAPRPAMAAVAGLNLHSLRDGKDSGYKLTIAAALGLTGLGVAVVYARGGGSPQASVAGTACTLVAVIGFLSSMSYGTLLGERRRYERLLSSLPVSATQWALCDIVSVQAIPLISALLLTAVWCWRSAPGWLAALPMIAVTGLGAVNYPIYKRAPRHAIALSLLALVAGLVLTAMVGGLIGGFGDT